jgi:2-oxoglutarate ferredoxin oxidoreductase subunit alpha
MDNGELEKRNAMLQRKYDLMKKSEVMFEQYDTADAKLVVVAFGIAARIALSAIRQLRREGRKVGMLRPVTLFPFPEKQLGYLATKGRRFMVIEMNAGQMVEDVRLAVNGKSEVLFFGRPGGAVFNPEELYAKVKAAYGK